MNGAPRYLTQIGPRWYYERAVPPYLAPYFKWRGKAVKRIREPTGFEDLAKAMVPYSKIHIEAENAFDAATAKVPSKRKEMSDQEILDCILAVMKKHGVMPQKGNHQLIISYCEQELNATFSKNLRTLFEDSMVDAAFAYLDYLRNSAGADGGWLPSSATPAPIPSRTPVINGPSLEKVMKQFLADPKASKSLASGSKSAFDLFKKFVGEETPFNQITRVECRGYQELLIEEDYKPSTLNSYLNKIGHLFTWAIAEQIINSHPGLNLKVKDGGSEKTGFTDDELNKLFPFDYMTKAHEEERFWLPLIMVLQGCRPNEAAQLHLPDIVVNHDIPHIFFHKCVVENGIVTKKLHPMKTIKENASNRRTPIHPTLIKLGFLDFVKSRKDKEQLFDLNRDRVPRSGVRATSSSYLRRGWPVDCQAGTADSMTMGSSLNGAMVSRVI